MSNIICKHMQFDAVLNRMDDWSYSLSWSVGNGSYGGTELGFATVTQAEGWIQNYVARGCLALKMREGAHGMVYACARHLQRLASMSILIGEQTIRNPDCSTTTVRLLQIGAAQYAVAQYLPTGESDGWPEVDRYNSLADAEQCYARIVAHHRSKATLLA